VRRFLIGRLRFTPHEIGRFRLGDIFDAINGYNEEDAGRLKQYAEVVRIATCILWNTQVTEEGRLNPEDLWPFSWENREETEGPQASAEEEERIVQHREYQKRFLEEHF
jgi:hypothetical protein